MRLRNRLIGTLALVLVASPAAVTRAVAAQNSGLDLTQPILQAGYAYQSTYFYPGVSGDANAFTASLPLSFGQFKVAFPYSEALHLASAKKDASGSGDLSLSYNYVLPSQGPQWRQTVGIAYQVPGTQALENHEQQLAPLYACTYSLNPSVSILMLAKYAVGYGAAAGSPRYDELTLSPSAVVALRSNTYLAVVPEYRQRFGERTQATYDSSLDIGRVVSGLNFRVSYGLPLGAYSYEHLYRSTYGVSASFQL